MIASVYIKGDNIHLYNENRRFSDLGGLVYRLGLPLLHFLTYEQERFDEAFFGIASAFETPDSSRALDKPEFLGEVKRMMAETQQREIYVYFYNLALYEAIYSGESPQGAVKKLADEFRKLQDFATNQINLLLNFREVISQYPEAEAENPTTPMELLYLLDEFNREKAFGGYFYLEKPFKAFYGVIKPPEVVELYEIDSIVDLFRFEFVKMIEREIYIKKCKNCGQFFVPNRRQDAEYCDRFIGDTGKRCSEIGAMLRYERKVASDPVWEVYKRNYRRQNSRTRSKKMTQTEFLQWSEQAAQKRDECLVGTLPFDEYVAWLEQGRIRKPRSKPDAAK
ncbi:MAG: DUF6076 domain-containing protein [Clostridiales bacterium]|jgi:hypothetical protein|nr:DUF6076 domain-containing protein [Clostridiales bacterium]